MERVKREDGRVGGRRRCVRYNTTGTRERAGCTKENCGPFSQTLGIRFISLVGACHPRADSA